MVVINGFKFYYINTYMSKLTLINSTMMEEYWSKKYDGNYSILISKYAMKFISGKDSVNLGDDMDRKIFIGYKMLVKHLESNDIWNKIKDNKMEFTGYDNKIFLDSCSFKNCINIDIKGAYPNALNNLGLVDKPTYSYIMSMPKLDRLKAIGMTAKRSMQFDFEAGKIVDYKINESSYRNCYFSAAKEIEEMMEYIKEIALDTFIFTWVDGIYLSENTDPKIINQICLALKEQNYNYHINRINIDVKRIKEVLHITTQDFGVIKQFAFKDVYYKKLNNKIINKYLTKLKHQ